jgi:hypothetical protein
MGFSDTFEFDEGEYARQISNELKYPTHSLKQNEVVKHRQHISACASTGAGIGLAPFTFGLSLLGSAYGARRLYIANKKLEIIQAELTRREVALHTPTKRDFIIPFSISMATLGLGAGADAVAVHATSQLATHAIADHGTRAVSDVLQNPVSVCHGVADGVSLQLHEVGQVFAGGLDHAIAVTNLASSYIVAGAPYVLPGELVGMAAGMSAASVAETKFAKWASGKIALRVIDRALPTKSQAFAYGEPPQTCRRRLYSNNIVCEHCKRPIDRENESFYRKNSLCLSSLNDYADIRTDCCQGHSASNKIVHDDYDACQNCIESLHKGCQNAKKHVLFKILPSGQTVSCARLTGTLARFKLTALVCSYCSSPISEDDYYRESLCPHLVANVKLTDLTIVVSARTTISTCAKHVTRKGKGALIQHTKR